MVGWSRVKLLPKASKEEGMSDAQAAEIAVRNLRLEQLMVCFFFPF